MLLFPALLTPLLGAQAIPYTPAADPDRPTVIRTTTTEVLLDVVVRDKHHHPVTNLRPEEVQLFEDGVPQKVKVFRNVRGSEQLASEQTAALSQAAGASGQPLNSLREVNFVSVVFAQIAPLNLDFARRAVLEFLKSDNLPNTYITIYRYDVNLNLVRAYTSNKATLEKAVEAATRGMYTKDDLNMGATVASGINATIQASIEAAEAAPQTGLNNLASGPTVTQDPITSIVNDPLWVRNSASNDASVNLGNALETQAGLESGLRMLNSMVDGMDSVGALHELVRSQEKLPGRKVVLYLADGLTFPVNRREVVDNLIGYANRAGVTFYTIDTRGLSTDDPMLQSLANLRRVDAESSLTKIDPGSAHHEVDDVQLTNMGSGQGALRELAESTGGFAVTDTNQIAEPMQRMMEDMRSHYELAYRPTSASLDGHFRTIDVKISRPKVTVQTRKGYYALPELNGKLLEPFELVALHAINAYPAPVAFPYDASIMKFRPAQDTVQCEMAFDIPMSGLKVVVDPKTGKSRIQASMVALIHDDKGEIVSKVSRDLVREVSLADQAQLGKDRILYAEPVNLPRGHYIVDTAVTDEAVGKTTVTHTPVTIDSGSDLGLSSLEVVRRVEPLAGAPNPSNPFELGADRVTPTLADSVASGKPMGLYFVVYPSNKVAGQETKFTLHLFQGGKEVASKVFALPKPQLDGSIPVLLQMTPIPGQYDIRVTAEQGTLVAQASRALKVE